MKKYSDIKVAPLERQLALISAINASLQVHGSLVRGLENLKDGLVTKKERKRFKQAIAVAKLGSVEGRYALRCLRLFSADVLVIVEASERELYVGTKNAMQYLAVLCGRGTASS